MANKTTSGPDSDLQKQNREGPGLTESPAGTRHSFEPGPGKTTLFGRWIEDLACAKAVFCDLT